MDSAFMPHGHCYLWTPSMVWLQVATDTLIGLSYFSIPLVLLKVMRVRRDIPFNGILLGFAIFILACGSTHFMEVWNVWHADYWFAGGVKGVTAIASLGTAVYLYRSQSELLRFPSPQQQADLNAGLERHVADLKAAGVALRDSEEQFRTAFEFAGIGMALVSVDGRFLRVNARLCEIVGYAESELLGRSFQEITHPDDLEGDLENMRDLLAGRRRYYHKEKRYIRHDGGTAWIRLTSALVRNGAGAPAHFVTQVEDFTERRQIESSLAEARDHAVEASRLKSQFLANMSHEIRTPMNGVVGMTSLLLDTELTPEQRDFAQTVRGSAEVLLNVLNDILDFSKIEAGMLRIDALPFDLREPMENSVALFAEQARAKGLALSCQLADGLPTQLVGDARRLHQVLVNLLSNAVKFTPRGAVTLRVARVTGDERSVCLRFTVHDTGIGIAAATQRELFQPFVQGDGSTTRKYGGTGLGLAISKHLVELMGGELGVESRPGEGSTFGFTLEFTRQEG